MRQILSILMIFCALFAGAATRTPKKSKAKKAKTTKVASAPKVPRPAREPFVTRVDAPTAKKGLAGKNIALWQSHGRYFDQNEDRWMWQRARLMGTVEDLYPQAYVLPYLIPMLENAGAYVMTPRERDAWTQEIIVDMDGGFAQKDYNEKNGQHKWTAAQGIKGFGYKKEILGDGDNPFRMGSVREVATVTDPAKASTASWYADFPEGGNYAVYVSYASLPNSAPEYKRHGGTHQHFVGKRQGYHRRCRPNRRRNGQCQPFGSGRRTDCQQLSSFHRGCTVLDAMGRCTVVGLQCHRWRERL